MANNNKKSPTERLRFVEPNRDGLGILPTEDLSIRVELETIRRGRSVIIAKSEDNDKIQNTQKKSSDTVSFIDGSNVGMGRRSLTTNYTQVRGLGHADDDDLESLGIENVAIEFDTAYTPNIKIKFIDIRGKAVLAQGTKSKYNMFFELPYPVFNLTVKGYYGKAVTYCLHLVKWNAAFNSNTGNFEIDAEFIGYTYAMLTDCLMGMMRAVVRTPIGSGIFQDYLDEPDPTVVKKTGEDYLRKYPGLRTIDEFLDYVSKINDEFGKVKEKSETIKQINSLNSLRDSIKALRNNSITLMSDFASSESMISADETTGDFVLISAKGNAPESNPDGTPNEDKKNTGYAYKVKKYKEETNDTLNGKNGLNKSIDVEVLKIKPSNNNKKDGIVFIPSLNLNLTKDSDFDSIIVTESAKSGTFPNIEQSVAEDIANKTGENFGSCVLYDFTEVNKEFKRIKEVIKEKREELDKIVIKELKTVAEKSEYKFTIRNIIDMFSIHAQVLLRTIEKVSNLAESNKSREKILKENLDDSVITDTDKIFPWPEYKQNRKKTTTSNAGNYETWIGSELDGNLFENVPEVKFTEELLEALMKIAKGDLKRELNLAGVKTPQFYPITPLDAAIDYEPTEGLLSTTVSDDDILTTSLITQNPYYHALMTTGTKTKGIPDEAIRVLLLRGYVGLGIGEVSPLDKHIPMMGSFEAENLFNVLLTEFGREKMRNFVNSIVDEYKGEDGSERLLNKWLTGSENVTNPNGELKKPLHTKTTGTSTTWTYSYVVDKLPSTINRAYIPISGNFDCSDFFYESGDTVTNLYKKGDMKNVSDLNKLSDELLFIGNNFNRSGNANAIMDGATYFKIIPGGGIDNNKTYTNSRTEPIFPTSGGEKFREYLKDMGADSIIWQDTLSQPTYKKTPIAPDGKLNNYNGRYKTLEISNIKYNSTWDIDNKYYKVDGNDEGVSSVLCAYWNQSEKTRVGTYLSNDYTEAYKDKSFYVMKKDDEEFLVQKRPGNNINIRGREVPTDFGKQRELLLNPNSELVVPFVEYRISNESGVIGDSFSLFGSRLYYRQNTDEARAFLFLHSFGWTGLIGDIKDQPDSYTNIDVSLFDLFDVDEDETTTIKGIFANNSAFLEAPKLWCAFIGGLLYRYDKFLQRDKFLDLQYSDLAWSTPSGSTAGSYLPKDNQYLYDVRSEQPNQYISPSGINFVFDEGDDEASDQRYPEIDDVLKGLPPQVRNEFISVFKEFVKTDFADIREDFELFGTDKSNPTTTTTSTNDLANLLSQWTALRATAKLSRISRVSPSDPKQVIKLVDANTNQTNNAAYRYNYLLTTSNVKAIITGMSGDDLMDNYLNVSPISLSSAVNQMDLTYRGNTEINEKLVNLIKSSVVIMNASPRSFRSDNPTSTYTPITVDGGVFDLYVKSFLETFRKRAKDWGKNNDTEADNLQKKLFNAIDDDIIKLNIYRTLASINNKWIGTGSDKGCTDITSIADNFKFLDSGFFDIGQQFYINPKSIESQIVGNYNQSFFDVVNKLLGDNNFNFIPLPSFIDFQKEKELQDVFKPYSWTESVDDESVKPSFVCVYIGQTSTNLDLGDDSTHKDDGIFIEHKDGDPLGASIPVAFQPDEERSKSMYIPYFLVSYAKGNQSFFKDIKLDQREFTETAESLQIIEDISQHGDKRKATFKGQNLFNVYQMRAYSAEVEMMGNAMIQPMMYFQLDDIPMFRGAYMILKVSHNITANSMTTKFKGTRIKDTKTDLITESELFMNLIGDFSDAGEADKITGDGTSGDGSSNGSSDGGVDRTKTNENIEKYGPFVDTPMDVNTLPINNDNKFGGAIPGIVAISGSGEKLKYGMREVVELLQTAFTDFITEAKNTTDVNETVFWNDISFNKGGITTDHTSHQIGVDIDFRQILSKKEKINNTAFSKKFYQTTSNSIDGTLKSYKGGTLNLINPVGDNRDAIGDYSRKGTRMLINQLRKKRVPIKTSDGELITYATVQYIWFNDSVLIEEGLCSPMKGHDNHLHVRFNIPDRVEKDITDNSGENTRQFYS